MKIDKATIIAVAVIMSVCFMSGSAWQEAKKRKERREASQVRIAYSNSKTRTTASYFEDAIHLLGETGSVVNNIVQLAFK